MKRAVIAFALSAAFAFSAQAGNLVYTPIDPSFGGNPLNSSHLLSVAGAQRNATASDANTSSSSSTGGTTGSSGLSNAQLFVQQLEGRLLSALASQVTDAIFGSNPQESGKVIFGDTTVTFSRTVGSIHLDIYNALDGTTTTIEVPQLQIQ